MRKLKIKIQVFKNGKVAGTLIRDKGGVRMHGLCGETIKGDRPLKEIVSALAAEGCVMKITRQDVGAIHCDRPVPGQTQEGRTQGSPLQEASL